MARILGPPTYVLFWCKFVILHTYSYSTQWTDLGVFRHESISRGHLTGQGFVRLSTKEGDCTLVRLCTRSKPKPCARGMWKTFICYANTLVLYVLKIWSVLKKVIEFNVVIFSIMFSVLTKVVFGVDQLFIRKFSVLFLFLHWLFIYLYCKFQGINFYEFK